MHRCKIRSEVLVPEIFPRKRPRKPLHSKQRVLYGLREPMSDLYGEGEGIRSVSRSSARTLRGDDDSDSSVRDGAIRVDSRFDQSPLAKRHGAQRYVRDSVDDTSNEGIESPVWRSADLTTPRSLNRNDDLEQRTRPAVDDAMSDFLGYDKDLNNADRGFANDPTDGLWDAQGDHETFDKGSANAHTGQQLTHHPDSDYDSDDNNDDNNDHDSNHDPDNDSPSRALRESNHDLHSTRRGSNRDIDSLPRTLKDVKRSESESSICAKEC